MSEERSVFGPVKPDPAALARRFRDAQFEVVSDDRLTEAQRAKLRELRPGSP